MRMEGQAGTLVLALERAKVMRGLSWGTTAFALLGAGAAVWFGVLVGRFPDPWDLWVPLLRLVSFGAAVVLGLIALWTYYAAHPPDGRILVDDEGITIDNPAVFRRPVRIPRSAVRAVSLERDVSPLPAEMPRELFPIEGGGSEACPYTHLASKVRRRCLLPGINPESVVANLAVVFDFPIEVPPTRFRGSLSPGLAPFRPPFLRRLLPGFFARVVDPEAAARVFAGWGVLRAPRAEEITVAAESAERNYRIKLGLAVGLMVAVVVLTR